MTRRIVPALTVILLLLASAVAMAQAPPALVGRLPCVNGASALRRSTFRLPIGLEMRLSDGKACVKPFAEYRGCEWTVTLSRAETWGPQGRYLVAVVDTLHDSPGEWSSVFVFTCRANRYVPVFAKNVGPRGGGKLVLVNDSTFEVTAGEWLPQDAGCCPSNERRTTYRWDERRRVFTEAGSQLTPLPTPR